MNLQDFIERVTLKPPPSNAASRVHTLARELAEGAVYRLWPHNIYLTEVPMDIYYTEKPPDIDEDEFYNSWVIVIESKSIQEYMDSRWNGDQPTFDILAQYGFIERRYQKLSNTHHQNEYWQITQKAFQLIDPIESASIFVSYKRSESSAFALLIYERLRYKEQAVFLDKDLKAGDNWQSSIEDNIIQSNYLILLLSKDTLNSDAVLRELALALDAEITIIPIWHNRFEYKSGEWKNVSVRIDELLKTTHTIRVLEESALGYNNAIVELLNRFGITP